MSRTLAAVLALFLVGFPVEGVLTLSLIGTAPVQQETPAEKWSPVDHSTTFRI